MRGWAESGRRGRRSMVEKWGLQRGRAAYPHRPLLPMAGNFPASVLRADDDLAGGPVDGQSPLSRQHLGEGFGIVGVEHAAELARREVGAFHDDLRRAVVA